jgi:ferredoxin
MPRPPDGKRKVIMKINIEFDMCDGHGECVIAAPEVFDLNQDGDTVVVLVENPDESLRPKIAAAAKQCPVAAIKFEDDK